MKRAVVIVFVLSATWPAVAACPKLVDPVCAVDTSRYLKTFNNKCEALRAGGKYLHEGACFAEFCTHLCIAHGIYGRGVFSGRTKLYDNLCWAEKDFAQYVSDGPCPRP